MKTLPMIGAADRLMVLAPHPDDETLGAGIAIQQARAAGAAVSVVFATAGEANPWPQRWCERRWRLDTNARERWGVRRSAEAQLALSLLGLDRGAAEFLGWPDSGIEHLLRADGDRAIAELAARIDEFRPTRLILPCLRDRHPDHSALNLMTRAALLTLRPVCSPVLLQFLVHAQRSAHVALEYCPAPSEAQLATKLDALEAHQTQMRLSRRRLRRRAIQREAFEWTTLMACEDGKRVLPGSVVRRVASDDSRLQLELDARHPAAERAHVALVLAGVSPGHVDLWRCAGNPDSTQLAVTDLANGFLLGHAHLVPDGRLLLLTLPRPLPGQLTYARFTRPRRWLRVVDRDIWAAF